ncbi:hypothetical protein EVAR_53047_1 [Eumeta japonica]|uniref:Uncharacterized protein n=1 Tax=Eumeta variegata TaxID=151549 RepID=A0A4C1YRS2_EUMVA|nr:hypothetical protein EVAR_53047_1 [Eumeta japonica]
MSINVEKSGADTAPPGRRAFFQLHLLYCRQGRQNKKLERIQERGKNGSGIAARSAVRGLWSALEVYSRRACSTKQAAD